MKETLFLYYYAAKKTRTSTGDTPTSPSSWRVCHSAMTEKPTISLYFWSGFLSTKVAKYFVWSFFKNTLRIAKYWWIKRTSSFLTSSIGTDTAVQSLSKVIFCRRFRKNIHRLCRISWWTSGPQKWHGRTQTEDIYKNIYQKSVVKPLALAMGI